MQIHKVLKIALDLHKKGQLADAEIAYRQILSQAPDHPDVLHLLGLIAHAQGRYAEAIADIEQALKHKRLNAVFHCSLAEAHQAAGEIARAQFHCEAALSSMPEFPAAHYRMGRIFFELGRLGDAIVSYRTALRLKPDWPAAQNDLGNAHLFSGQIELAEIAFQTAILQHPTFALAHYNLGNVFRARGEPEQAIQCFRRAIDLDPHFAEAHFNLARCLAEQNQFDEALACSQAAFRLRPDSPKIAGGLAALLLDANRFEEAAQVFAHAQVAGQDSFGFRLRALICLPRIIESADQINGIRARLATGLDALSGEGGFIQNPPEVIDEVMFYLAYAGENDRMLMEKTHRLFRIHGPSLNYVSGHIEDIRKARRANPKKRIRIGFLSQFFYRHTIGKLTKGVIAELSRETFNVVVIHTQETKHDQWRRDIDNAADEVLVLPADLHSAQRAVADLRLDILHYPDIGMSAFTYFLAFARLAPVQTVGWGHPDTTGIDTIDYFISFAAAEPEGAVAHYSETLICLSRPAVFYEPDALITAKLPRTDFGLPAVGTLYGCLQSLFKFHPDFDPVLAEVLDRDEAGWIVVVDGMHSAWREILRKRWSERYPKLCDRVLFHPRLSEERFRHLVCNMDVLIDPVHFGGGNTFYEAAAQGMPTVTWPGRFLRGRIITGLYRLLGMRSEIIDDISAYAAAAVALAHDGTRRNRLRDELLSHGLSLFRDHSAVRELEAFFVKATDAAIADEKIMNWRWQMTA